MRFGMWLDGMAKRKQRLGLETVHMPLWAASINLAVADFFLGTAGDFYELSAMGFFPYVLCLKYREI